MGTQVYWKEETRDRLAASLVGFWRRHLALPDSYISEVANEFGRNGRSDADIAILRNIRLKYLTRARSVRAENIEVFNRVMPELINVCGADPVDSTARDLAVTNAANAFRAGSTGTKRTKKAQSRMIGKLAYQYKLDFDGDVVSLLSNELRITPVMPQSYAILQKLYRGTFANLTEENLEELVDKDEPFSIANADIVFNRLEKNMASFSLLQNMLAKEGGNREQLLVKMKEKFDKLSANGSANIESTNNLSRLQSLYRNALTKDERKGGDPFSLKHFNVVEERLREDPESATLLKEQLAKVGGNQEELLAKMKEKFDKLSANGSANIESTNNLSTLQSLYRNALTEDEQKDGDPFSLKHFNVVEQRLKTNPTSATLLKEQLAKVGGNQEELLAKMKARVETLSLFGGNQNISFSPEGDVVNQILLYHFNGDLVLTTTKTTNVGVKGKTWDAYKRLVETPNPLDASQTMGDLLGLSDVKEENLCRAIKCRAGLVLNVSGTGPHLLAGIPFHLLTVTASKPGKYLVKDLGFKEGALQVWVDAVQVRNNNQSSSVLGLWAEAASLKMDIDELREKYLGKIANILNRSGTHAHSYSTAQKDYLLAVLNVLTIALRDYIISTSRGNVYRRPSLDQAADVLSDALSEDTTLQFSGFTSIAVGVGEGARSLPQVITGEMNRDDKQKLRVTIGSAGKNFDVAIYPKSSHELTRMGITAICIVLNKICGFDKMERTIKQDTIVKICK